MNEDLFKDSFKKLNLEPNQVALIAIVEIVSSVEKVRSPKIYKSNSRPEARETIQSFQMIYKRF